jgi:hypothetical protein
VIIQELLQVLKPLGLAVKELSKNDANLLTSEGVHIFMFKKLGENSEIGNDDRLIYITAPKGGYLQDII